MLKGFIHYKNNVIQPVSERPEMKSIPFLPVPLFRKSVLSKELLIKCKINFDVLKAGCKRTAEHPVFWWFVEF